VHTLHPFFSDFSFLRKEDSLPVNRIQRWNKIVLSATQQCGRGELMQIAPPVPLRSLPVFTNPSSQRLCLFAYEGDGVLDVRSFLQEKTSQIHSIQELWPLVGSEGGFSSTEVQFLADKGLKPLTLGPQVLRVETACLTLVSILKYEFGLMR
ncbi:MAG: RsmE family RNA methyltransferase, partial [Bdellovibrionaceae bacterium]|nr:RsmE family RNA methyltransferase [Pseudobdellovibrionaceae bacterium]